MSDVYEHQSKVCYIKFIITNATTNFFLIAKDNEC